MNPYAHDSDLDEKSDNISIHLLSVLRHAVSKARTGFAVGSGTSIFRKQKPSTLVFDMMRCYQAMSVGYVLERYLERGRQRAKMRTSFLSPSAKIR
jgi:hypothetical protein